MPPGLGRLRHGRPSSSSHRATAGRTPPTARAAGPARRRWCAGPPRRRRAGRAPPVGGAGWAASGREPGPPPTAGSGRRRAGCRGSPSLPSVALGVGSSTCDSGGRNPAPARRRPGCRCRWLAASAAAGRRRSASVRRARCGVVRPAVALAEDRLSATVGVGSSVAVGDRRPVRQRSAGGLASPGSTGPAARAARDPVRRRTPTAVGVGSSAVAATGRLDQVGQAVLVAGAFAVTGARCRQRRHPRRCGRRRVASRNSRSRRWAAPMSDARRHIQLVSYPIAARSAWTTSSPRRRRAATFSTKTSCGRSTRTASATAVHRLECSPVMPTRFPALEMSWHGKPAVRMSTGSTWVQSTVRMSPRLATPASRSVQDGYLARAGPLLRLDLTRTVGHRRVGGWGPL